MISAVLGWRIWRVLGWILLVILLLPTALVLLYRFVNPPITPLMVIRAIQGYPREHRWVPLEEIAPSLRQAVIAAEDNLFCRHWGFDLGAIQDEIERALAGERPRGASTITQQTAKNVILWPGRDPARKGLEALTTPQLELFWNKQRILEVYLNIIELGPGIYGAEAAARHWFKKPASALTQREAASLAALLPSPLRRSPVRPNAAQARRTQVILGRMEQLGDMLACARPST